MSGWVGKGAAAGTVALGLAIAGGAQAAVISFMPNAPLSATPTTISFGNGAATYSFTAASTGFGPGAAVSTGGNAQVSSFFGGVTDFFAGAPIDQNSQIYSFSAFPTASLIPNSSAIDYIGLAFTLLDGLHYGYAQVAGPQLTSYAYESVPGATILTGTVATAVPEPASITLVLAGIAGAAVAVRRRRRT